MWCDLPACKAVAGAMQEGKSVANRGDFSQIDCNFSQFEPRLHPEGAILVPQESPRGDKEKAGVRSNATQPHVTPSKRSVP